MYWRMYVGLAPQTVSRKRHQFSHFRVSNKSKTQFLVCATCNLSAPFFLRFF